MTTAPIDDAVAAFARGEFVVVVDDEQRENEGDLILAAEKVTREKIGFMVRHTSGLICVPMEGRRLDELGLPLMVRENTESHKTAFTISVDATDGTSTGISASDRAHTITALLDPETRTTDLARPGHVFPLRYKPGGVLVRPGHTEAAIDLARMAGLYPAGVLAEVVNDDGTMARLPELLAFADRHRIPIITIADLVDHRWRTEALVKREVEADIPTEFGTLRAHGYRSSIDGSEHIALVFGDIAGKSGVLTRVHSECLTGDVFGSSRCDCGQQLKEATRRIVSEQQGVIVYDRRHEGRGIGLLQKLKAYRLQDGGLDTVEANLTLGHPADARHYGTEAQILTDLKIESVRLLTNSPDKVSQLTRLGIVIDERVPLEVAASPHNVAYLNAKAEKLGHYLNGNSES